MAKCQAFSNYTHVEHPLNGADWAVIVIYFVTCIAIGLIASFKTNRSGTTKEYFLAGKSVLWWAVGGSLFASNIGSEHFVGLAGQGATHGISVGAYEWTAIGILLLLGWIFIPVYKQCRVFTMPEYIQKRYQNRHLRTFLTLLSLLIYVLTKISVDLYAGDIFLEETFGINIYLGTIILLVITAVYTLLGGLSAVVYTEVLQSSIMVIGAIVLAIIGFVKVGGYSGLMSEYLNVTNYTDPKAFHVIRPADVKSPDLPWPGILFALPVTGIYYWCSDQVIVQRVLGAKDANHAKAGTVLTGYLKILPMFIMVLPGMISRVLYNDIVGQKNCGNLAYPTLVLKLAGHGLRGLMLAVMMAALMSSLASTFNSSSTLFAMDVWRRWRTAASERELLVVGRVVVLVMVAISIVWVPIVENFQGGLLFNYIQTISSYLMPPVTAVFLAGLLWKRATGKGAVAGLVTGVPVGLICLILLFIYPNPDEGEPDTRPRVLRLHYLYITLILFGISLVALVVVSLFTQPRSDSELGGLTWWTRNEPYLETTTTTTTDDETAEDKIALDAAAREDVGGTEQDDDVAAAETSLSDTLLSEADYGAANESKATADDPPSLPANELRRTFGWVLWGYLKDWMFGASAVSRHCDEDDSSPVVIEWPKRQRWALIGATVVLLVVWIALWIIFR